MKPVSCMECKYAQFKKSVFSTEDGIYCSRLGRWEPMPDYLNYWELQNCSGTLPLGCVLGESRARMS